MKQAVQLLLSYFPTTLPTGMTQFDLWAERIMDLTGPMADRTSMKFVLASNLTNIGNTESRKPDQFFIRALRVAATRQVASQVFIDLKQKQLDEAKKAAEAAQQQAEVTAQQATATSNETAKEA